MGIKIEFTNNGPQTLNAIKKAQTNALEICGIDGEGFAKDKCPVDTGQLRNSISHSVSDNVCYIGTNCDHAAYVELGTGIYYPGGRQTPWCYQDSHGNWHMTHGQRAQPYLKPAVSDHNSEYERDIRSAFENG